MMRVLFFLEPVIFRQDPCMLTAHFLWVDCIKRAVDAAQGVFALVANAQTCEAWKEKNAHNEASLVCFPLDAFAVLSSFRYKRAEYAHALYGLGNIHNNLTQMLRQIRNDFSPNLVVMSSQNAFANHVFSDIPIVSLEQALLPRFMQPVRTGFDCKGHQIRSILETHIREIKSFPITMRDREQLQILLEKIMRRSLLIDPRTESAQAALKKIKEEGPVALLATQPPDWVTYEGAYEAIEVENLLYSWAQQLPVGWIGVPTYHPGFRLSESLEQALQRSCLQLRFLPQQFSQGFTEPLLHQADGLITISSTCAITALLLQKPAIVTGRSFFNAWCASKPGDIANAKILTADEATSLFAFLCHRFSYLHNELMHNPLPLIRLMEQCIILENPEEWFLDISDWSVERAYSLFDLNLP